MNRTMERIKTVSLCMIVKNEEAYLEKCLQSAAPLVDEIIIVDTGSTDSTVDIAKKFDARVFHYEWDHNFSNARNFSLEQASCDWILLMDGDDEFNALYYDEFTTLVNTSDKDGHYMKTMSYTGSSPGRDVVTNLNLRLLRNNKNYKFTGAIHEQIARIDSAIDYRNFPTSDIEIFHYGYLTSVADEKDKRTRNMSIIEQELKKDPTNAFHTFNLGNEYFALGELEKALELFEKVYYTMDYKSGFASKLVIRRVMCLDELMRYDQACKAIDEGLTLYPGFTDLEFIRGCICMKRKRYTHAMDSFKTCLQMGSPPVNLEFIEGCGGFRPHEALGDIYFRFEAYEDALVSFEESVKCNPKHQNIMYKIGAALSKLYDDNNYICHRLSKYFNLTHTPNLLLISNILLKEKLADAAMGYLDMAEEANPGASATLFLKGVALFRLGRFSEAEHYFNKSGSDTYKESARYRFIDSLLLPDQDTTRLLESIEAHTDFLTACVYRQLYNIFVGADEDLLGDTDQPEKALALTINILEEVLLCRQFDLFEQLLGVLNYIPSESVLLALAKLYDRQNYGKMAVREILRSIKELDAFDNEAADILYRQLH